MILVATSCRAGFFATIAGGKGCQYLLANDLLGPLIHLGMSTVASRPTSPIELLAQQISRFPRC